jgi:hypothetical protein
MAEQLYKLSPHRDLQCYFLTPSAIAAMSGASASGFTVSGKWRQQFDWAVVEWNRDNTFDHPSLRPLPDGDLSGLVLSYQEERTGCIPMESNLVPVVDWNNLRIWATDNDGNENVYHVNLWPSYATAIEGTYIAASATMTLMASPGVSNRVGLALLESHHYYTVQAGDSLEQIAAGIAQDILSNPDFTANSNGPSVTITWKAGPNYGQLLGANGNRITVYGFQEGGSTCWQNPAAVFSRGQFPNKYEVSIDFGQLKAQQNIPTDRVRKLRWTWAADLQQGSFQQAEFQVTVSNWTLTGNAGYSVAGPGSRRIEDTNPTVMYTGSWQLASGNYSGSRIHLTQEQNDSCSITYSETAEHELYLGTRLLAGGALLNVSVDGQTLAPISLALNGEDVLIRSSLGTVSAGSHTVVLTHGGPSGASLYFDFLEIAYPSATLPDFPSQQQLALATDWDTYHSQSLPAERTAWMINKLGFQGRLNHYTGALWFYELFRPGTQYATLTLTLTPEAYSGSPTVILDIAATTASAVTQIKHLVLPDDTPATVAQALAGLINLGTNLVWASANGNQLTLTARAMGTAGNGIFVQADPQSQGYSITSNGNVLVGGVDGTPYKLDITDPLNSTLIAAADYWRTDLTATPRLNRAARDWHAAYFTALRGYGIDSVASFSTELMNGDPSATTGIAQCYPDGSPVVLNTPSIQTNFSTTALAFWQQVYLDMAAIQASAGMVPYLQSGELQWWYFPKAGSGMPFYDAYTQQEFQAKYNTPMQVISSNTTDPTQYPNECAFLPSLIGTYTAAIRNALRSQYPSARYEVLYPVDTNDTALNGIVNYPVSDWTPANLTCLKTESFTFTQNYNLDQSSYSMSVSAAQGFPNSSRSHLVGISDEWTAWMKEVDLAQSQGMESVVLFALDQFCLIGYPLPPYGKNSRTLPQG